MATNPPDSGIKNYPDFCIYCIRKYNSEACILPYALVSKLSLPDDHTEAAIQLTEVHCTYHYDALNEAAAMTKWHISNSNSRTGTIDGSSHFGHVRQDIPTELISSTVNSDPTGEPAPSKTEGIPLPRDEPVSLPPPRPETAQLVLPPTTTLEPVISEPAPKAETTTQSPLTTGNLRQLEKETKTTPPPEALTLKEGLHLTRDVAAALVTAQNLRKKKRTDSTLAQLRDALVAELLEKQRRGTAYKAHTSTPLDHPIAYARQVIANHTDQHVLQWTKRQALTDCNPKGCYLCHSRTNPFAIADPTAKRMDNYLLLFVRHALNALQTHRTHSKDFIRSLKHLLTDHKMEKSLDWITQPDLSKIYLDDPELIKSESLTNTAKALSAKQLSQMKENEGPPLPTQTASLLSSKLPKIIVDTLNNEDSLFKQASTLLLDPTLLIALTTDVVRHYPKWMTPQFCVSPGMAKLLLQKKQITTSSYDELLLAYGLTEILTSLRDVQIQN